MPTRIHLQSQIDNYFALELVNIKELECRMKHFALIIFSLVTTNCLATELTTAGYRKPSLSLTKSEAELVREYNDLNSSCRGGSGDDEKTLKACERRDRIIGPKLERKHINPFNYPIN